MTLDVKDRIIRARVQMLKRYPFFGYLAMYLNIKPFSDQMRKTMGEDKLTMAVDKYSNLMYEEAFVKKLSDDELMAVLAHEVMHVAQMHLQRLGIRDMNTWNIATDLVINRLLEMNGLTLPVGAITSAELKKLNVDIPNPELFSAEEIYQKVYKKLPKMYMDIHIYSESGLDGGKAKKDNKGNIDKQYNENEWKNRIVEAAQISKEKGNAPKGMERYIDDLIEPKLDWKNLLLKYITREIPFDYSWLRPSKKSSTTGIYLPSTVREGLTIVASVDTSGSMSNKDLAEAMSELMNIVKAYPYLNLTVIICDAKIHKVYDVTPYNTEEIKSVILQGGGGTTHKPVYQWLDENKPNTRIIVNLTDGYTEFPETDRGYNTIWVLTSNGCKEEDIPFGRVLRVQN